MTNADDGIGFQRREGSSEVGSPIGGPSLKPEFATWPLGQITERALQKLISKGESHLAGEFFAENARLWRRSWLGLVHGRSAVSPGGTAALLSLLGTHWQRIPRRLLIQNLGIQIFNNLPKVFGHPLQPLWVQPNVSCNLPEVIVRFHAVRP